MNHGVTTSETPTSIVPILAAAAGIPVVVGCAPLFKASSPVAVNEAIYAESYEDVVKKLGVDKDDDFENYDLSEFAYSHMGLFQSQPVVLINVFDPTQYTATVASEAVVFENKTAKLDFGGISSSGFSLKKGETTLVKGTDYSVDLATGTITALISANVPDGSGYTAAYTHADPTKVTSDDIIGGITDGKKTGLEAISDVFSRFRVVPGQILAPRFSIDSKVAAVMATKAANISGIFKAIAIVDIPVSGVNAVTDYSLVPAYKNTNNLTSPYQVVCWPKVKLGDREYRLSTQLAGAACVTDAGTDDIPYKSPSNKSLKADSAIAGSDKIWLSITEANYLNSNGICTALNFVGGWKTWGNRTACFPTNTDVKDNFIAIKRMFNWVQNSIILTTWEKVDDPTNKRLIGTVVDSLNIWLNSLTAKGALLGGKIEFLESENSITDLMNGIVRFHVYMTPPSPAEQMDFVVEYNAAYLSALFA